jgi:mRNA interferase HigB
VVPALSMLKAQFNKYRLVAHVAYAYKRILVKFVGTHAEYDRIDVETIR